MKKGSIASGFLLLLALVVSSLPTVRAAKPKEQARNILDETDVQGGLVVHVGCGDGKLTADLRASDRPQMIADFRNSIGFDAWAPPLVLMTQEPAKAVQADHIARSCCLDGFWFLDGRTLQVRRER